MPVLCFPCSNTTHFDEKPVPKAEDVDTNTDDGLQKPTNAEYAREAAKEFLGVLEAVAQEIPIPGVGAAVKIATSIINACEESHATLQKAEELELRIKMLVTVVVNELKEKKSNEIEEKLKEDIDTLQRELKYIEKKLDEIASQHALLLVLFRSFNEEKVQNCMNRLDGLLERFTITRHIDHAKLLDRLEKEIISFYTAQKRTLDHIQNVVEDINVTMKDVKAIMENKPATGSSPGARAPVPANSNLFFGRDALVLDLVACLTRPSEGLEQTQLCILGPGGMGKTSTALAVMAHPDVKKIYPDSSRVWVPCVKATSVSLLLDTLCSSLGITQITGNVRDNIFAVLKSSDPLILLFDNFETPWNVDGGRSEAERILREIGQILHVRLFVTMRSSTPPCKGLPWHSVDLKALDAGAARRIYSEIYPDNSADPQLPALLELVGNMPLAITLMATIAGLTGLSAADLMGQYKAVGPTLLSQGSDAENSMDICISLSVDSPPMRRNPEAQWLLAALAMLPVGTSFNMLSKWWARRLSNLPGALQILRETSLIERKDVVFCVLPVIQGYVLNPTRFNIDIRTSMIESACTYLEQHKSSPGDELYRMHAEALADEESNLEAILLQAPAASVEAINALLVLARYQASARPRTNIIEHALQLVLRMKDEKSLHASILSSYGHICHSLNRYEEARKHFKDGRELFLSVPDMKQAAECLFGLVDISLVDGTMSSSQMQSLVSQAQTDFESINDGHGIAQCWFYHGFTARKAGNFSTALDLLHRAYNKSAEYKDSHLSARCSDFIASSYYWKGDLEQAESWAKSAVEGFERVGPSERSLNAGLRQGYILNANGKYPIALRVFVRCLEQAKIFGAPLHMGLALQHMGVSWMKMGQREDARGVLQEALDVFPSMSGRTDLALCRYLVRKIDEPDAVPTYSEKRAVELNYPPKARQLLGLL